MVLLGFPWSLLPIPSPWRSDHGVTVFVTGFCLLNWMIVSILLMRFIRHGYVWRTHVGSDQTVAQ